VDDVSPTTKGARRCTNPECEYGRRWIIGKMRRLKNGKLSCLGRGCRTVYEPRDVIDVGSDDFRLWVE
jgi:hypothetical protein